MSLKTPSFRSVLGTRSFLAARRVLHVAFVLICLSATATAEDDPQRSEREKSETEKTESVDAEKSDAENAESETADVQDAKDGEGQDPASDAEPNTVSLDGVFVAKKSTELTTEADQLGALTIEKIVPHGTHVKKGQNLVWFEREDPDDKLETAEIDLQLAKLDLAEAEFQLEQFQKVQRLDRQAADREKKAAKQAYDNFMRVDRERQIESAQFNRKQAEASLANAQEELEQLRQMYEADDLTEESEEIVLERAKQAVEAAQFRLEGVEIQSNRVVEQDVPQETEEQKEQLSRAELTHQETVTKQRRERQRRQLEFKKEQDKVADLEKKLERLRKQRNALVLTAPHDGIVVHGALTRGRLGEKPSQLDVGTSVSADQVVVTVLEPSSLQISVDVPEDQLAKLEEGMKVTVIPSAAQQQTISGTVQQIGSIPYAGTKFDATVSCTLDDDDLIRPTMTCKVEITP